MHRQRHGRHMSVATKEEQHDKVTIRRKIKRQTNSECLETGGTSFPFLCKVVDDGGGGSVGCRYRRDE